MNEQVRSLKGCFLIAMPSLLDMRFAKTVIFVCEHTADGAMGLIINKPLVGIHFADICRQLGSPVPRGEEPRVYYGGPVSPEHGFILHTKTPLLPENSIRVNESLFLTADRSMLTAIGEGRGPERFIFCLGYAGWGANQLETEIGEDSWIVVPADGPIIFDLSDEKKWTEAARKNGIDLNLVSGMAGNA